MGRFEPITVREVDRPFWYRRRSRLAIPLGRNDFEVAQVLDLAGRDDLIVEQIADDHDAPLDGYCSVLEPRHQAFDAEATVAGDQPISRQDAFHVGMCREYTACAQQSQTLSGWPSSSITRPETMPQGWRRMVNGLASSPFR